MTAGPTTDPAALARSLRLSQGDVERLQGDGGADARIATMGRLVGDMETGALTSAEMRLARDVLAAFAADAEAEVRAAVAWQIHNSTLLTPELAERLARDVGSIAFPILRHAELLPDDLLVEIVAERDPQKQLAIAGRRQVSGRVSQALVETGNLVTVVHLLRNRGAHVAESALSRAMERFGQLKAVADSIAARPELTMALVERLIAFVSADIRDTLVTRYRLPPKLAARLAERGRESATLRLLQPLLLNGDDAEMVARHLHRSGRLTPQLLFRALCAGDHELYEAGVAARAGISLGAARMLAWEGGHLGIRCLFDAAALPWVLSRPFQTAIQSAVESGYPDTCSRADFQAHVLDRLFTECSRAQEPAVDDLLLQVCDQPGVDIHALLLPRR